MQAFQPVISQAIPLDLNHVDTDMIISAQFLTKIDREGYGEHLFQRLREQDPNFVFNDARYQGRRILLTKTNFGCGSSREHAVWALMQSGIHVIIAESYSDIFHNNAGKNGLLLITQAPEAIDSLMQQVTQDDIMLTIDLSEQRITTSGDEIRHFDYDPFRKACFLKGQDDLDYLLEAVS